MTDHPHQPDASFDGGTLDCGNGLLLLIRRHIDPLGPSQLLEILSAEPTVAEDLPAWCRLTGNELVSQIELSDRRSYLVSKGPFDAGSLRTAATERESMPLTQAILEVKIPASLPRPADAPPVPALAVMGVGSWPRPSWLLRALHQRLEGRLDDTEFAATADDAVRLAVQAQIRAGADVITDGEQRRDNYSSFVGGLLDNCQLVPLTDLLPYVDDPDEFAAELAELDVPASEVRHPAVFGPLGRSRPLAVHEVEFTRQLTDKPIKVSLPGPYLLTRTMWMECISDRAYANREDLARDVVRVLREELHFLLATGASLVQLDEPVLTEVAFGASVNGRSFMCGALGERGSTDDELAFAKGLLQDVVAGLPAERLALHVCRGNWSTDESVALTGDYRPLLPVLADVPIGTLVLEMCTPRAGEQEILRAIPDDRRIGVGVVNQKHARIETVEEVMAKAQGAIDLFGMERVLLNPDCGFATFADNPIATAEVAERKLAAMAEASRRLRGD
ncbi:5-methyltetrahydropteroyltriglutamate--homocysteine methyltransferase [Planctomycetes bacterium Pla163]|uniref:5-methyltetrahydropteroyltriglutamate--homocysteine methyltransferase n=1 Tax=Rohdeia mirabilis TaxID=2528008 RepID=A0A518CW95_9BACT|nr:5-methyltetrahydropteroyltriglutamate--homocysteine methyltransferase [Planctomycetes bacterium Pla163]